MGNRFRLSRRGRIAVLVTIALFAGGLFAGYRFVFAGTRCEATVDGRSVALDRSAAERAATALAPGSGHLRSTAQAAAVVARSTGLSGQDSAVLAAALTGRARAALTCRGGGAGDSESDRLDARGLTRRAERVRQDVNDRFGNPPLGGFAPGGVHTGHMPGSAHYEGRAIDVFFRPINAADKQRGWALAQYLVAHAERLEINTVIFDGQIWSARYSSFGWRDYSVSHAGLSAATVAILEHRDHVHVDVAD